MHCGYVVKVDQIRKHENADRLQIATFFGNDTVVSMDTKKGDLGVYFPSDLQLSQEFCEINNLVRKKDENGNNIGGFLDPDKRNIKAIKLRGEKSDGLFMPLDSFAYCWDLDKADVPEGCAITIPLGLGDQVTVLNGHEICQKYIPKCNKRVGHYSEGNRTRKHREPYAPDFAEHVDTEQLAYNFGAFKAGDEVELTLKMHGTSQRTGYLPVFKGYKRTFWDIILRRKGKPIYDYDYVSGTRRVVMENFEGTTSYYGSNEFREQHHNAFVGKLMKGETVFYEVLGFTHTGAPIMANGDNSKVGKDFVKQYGKETIFSYGCSPDGVGYFRDNEANLIGIENSVPQSILRVYRMTMTNPDGFVVEYTPDFVRYRCAQMGVETVPVFEKFTIPAKNKAPGEYVMNKVEKYLDGPDPVGKTHTREGVVARIINRPKFAAYKAKCYDFKILEGLIKESAEAPDMEEAQDVAE